MSTLAALPLFVHWFFETLGLANTIIIVLLVLILLSINNQSIIKLLRNTIIYTALALLLVLAIVGIPMLAKGVFG